MSERRGLIDRQEVGLTVAQQCELLAIGNKKHEQHEEMLEWVGGQFDPEEFDAAKATKAMKKGLPDWRKEA